MSCSDTRPRRVLVAGYQELFRKSLVSLLRGERFEFIEVDQGRDALAWLRTNLVDAAIVDANIFEVMVMDHFHPSLTEQAPLPLVVCGSGPQVGWNGNDTYPEGMVVLPRPFSKRDLLAALHNVREDAPHKETEPVEPAGQPDRRVEFFGRLAAGVVHDFNNLLTIILGASEILELETPASDPHRIFVEQIQQAAQKGSSLIHQLKALSKNQLPKHRMLDLNQVLDRIDTLMRHLVGRNVRIDMELGEDLDLIEADQGQIEQIIMNLALNARDAMPSGGSLKITTANLVLSHQINLQDSIPPGPYVILTIKDTGVGMDEETLDRLFEPFFTTKEPGRGSGLGLVNVHSILNSCGGHVAVSSKVGNGTTFTLFFPRAVRPAAVV